MKLGRKALTRLGFGLSLPFTGGPMRRNWLAGVLLALMAVAAMTFTKAPPDLQSDTASITVAVAAEHSPGMPPEIVPAVYILESAYEHLAPALEGSPPLAAAKMLMAATNSLHRSGIATSMRSMKYGISEVMPAQGHPAESFDPRPRFGTHLRT